MVSSNNESDIIREKKGHKKIEVSKTRIQSELIPENQEKEGHHSLGYNHNVNVMYGGLTSENDGGFNNLSSEVSSQQQLKLDLVIKKKHSDMMSKGLANAFDDMILFALKAPRKQRGPTEYRMDSDAVQN